MTKYKNNLIIAVVALLTSFYFCYAQDTLPLSNINSIIDNKNRTLTISTNTENISTNLSIVNASSTLDYKYIQIINSCNYAFVGLCVNVRSGPSTDYMKIKKLRNGIVLRVSEKIVKSDGEWYKIDFSKERVAKSKASVMEWYVRSDFTKPVKDVLLELYDPYNVVDADNKKIVIDVKNQKLYAYETKNGKDELYMTTKISTGKSDTPTDNGEYYIFYKTPSRYMQSTTTSATNTPYDLPGVPFDMYFNEDGSAIHGAYWHNSFGRQWSHGCINLQLAESEKLYRWAPIGTVVLIRNTK